MQRLAVYRAKWYRWQLRVEAGVPTREILQESAAFRILPNETSNSRAATNHETPTVLGWGFFSSVGDNSRVFARIPACRLRRSAIRPIFRHILLSGRAPHQAPEV